MPSADLLEAFATPAGAPLVIEHVHEEFTSVCPKTRHPDFGEVVVRYQPARAGTPEGQGGCVELKSLKLYLHSFRNEGVFFEAVTGRVRDDLVRVLRPAWLQVITRWKGRGGIRSIIRADHGDVPACYLGAG